uniref:Uncharacterized protein n=1 Tax=Physcomitrium patens TaxID=3218 RepID=A0A2K1IB56_PHYPA|nr:hypothetical protein PHYPA_031074 [Physcomitrium patens]
MPALLPHVYIRCKQHAMLGLDDIAASLGMRLLRAKSPASAPKKAYITTCACRYHRIAVALNEATSREAAEGEGSNSLTLVIRPETCQRSVQPVTQTSLKDPGKLLVRILLHCTKEIMVESVSIRYQG